MGRVLGIALLVVVAAIYALATMGGTKKGDGKNPAARGETYRLVHAIGNTERINARGLSLSECEARKSEMKTVVVTLGTGGSVTCLPDSLFDD